MKITTVGRKVSIKNAFQELAQKKLTKLDKFFSNDAVATITVTVEKNWQTVEVSIKDAKLNFRSEKSADSMELALEQAIDSLEHQIVRNKNKLSQKYKDNSAAFFADNFELEDDYQVERTKVFHLTPQSVDDAILDMNMLGHTFFLFKDIVTQEINVVYKRKDGNYGVLIPE